MPWMSTHFWAAAAATIHHELSIEVEHCFIASQLQINNILWLSAAVQSDTTEQVIKPQWTLRQDSSSIRISLLFSLLSQQLLDVAK